MPWKVTGTVNTKSSKDIRAPFICTRKQLQRTFEGDGIALVLGYNMAAGDDRDRREMIGNERATATVAPSTREFIGLPKT